MKIAFSIFIFLLAGCAHFQKPTDPELLQCSQSLKKLQNLVNQEKVNDAQYQPLHDFPTYRGNRFWSAFFEKELSQEQEQYIRKQLHRFGMEGLRTEWQNLSIQSKEFFSKDSGYSTFDAFAGQCDTTLWQASLQQGITAKQANIDDSYSTWLRFFGFYSLTKLMAASSIEEYQQEMRQRIEGFQEKQLKTVRVYSPTGKPNGLSKQFSQWLTQALDSNPLQVPTLTKNQLTELAQWHSPHFRIGQKSHADKIGSATWKNKQRTINSTKPTVYFYTSYIRYENEVLLQLNYTAWFSERPKPSPQDWYGGKLDGLVWRVTLQNNGQILFYDSIHPCGCYHSVHIPTKSPLHDLVNSNQGEDILEPILYFSTSVDSSQPHPMLTLTADEHYLVNLSSRNISGKHPYTLNDYDELRSLPFAEGYKSWFDHDGIIASSERFERYFLWPLGVPSAGAMRQQGNHAIAFIGKRHFDEASVEALLNLKSE